MTVCVAAICTFPGPDGGYMIIGASDRMLSAPDIKFEPPQKKLYQFSESAVALVAGDPYAQIAICNEVARANRLKPRKTISEIADLYADAFSAYRRKEAEAKYLKPIGLDANSLIDRSHDIAADLLSGLRMDMQRAELEAEAIIAGFDETGPHIFVITDPGRVACADSLAFASIGSGKNHADSYLMMAHHTRNTSSHKAILDVYVAKRRAEISPTVGHATDLFYIGAAGFNDMADEIVEKVESVRKKLEKKIEAAHAAAAAETVNFIDSVVSRYRPPLETNDDDIPQISNSEGDDDVASSS